VTRPATRGTGHHRIATSADRLWTATTYCMPIERRIALLNVSEATAREQHGACVRRSGRARAAASR
jgi:hypothetical protein